MTLRFSLSRYLISLWMISVLAIPWPLLANPAGGKVKGGSVTFKQKGDKLTIRQNSDRAVIEWKDFSIQKGETTRFIQPSKSSSALNRVNGGTRSLINGNLKANGQVILINPVGVTVGPNGAVNVNSFIGSTLDVSDEEFTKGKALRFSGESEQSVVNLGKVRAAGGDAVLIGRKVENRGSIEAPNGTAALAAGSEVLVDPDGEDLIKIKPAAGKFGEASHTGRIEAVAVEIKAAGNPYATAINLDGIVTAKGSIAKPRAKVKVDAGAGGTRVGSATLVKAASLEKPDVRIYGGKVELEEGVRIEAPGGFVETSGTHVAVAEGVDVDTRAEDGTVGTWLIDPTDFRIISGGGAQTSSSIGAATLETSLATTSVQIATVATGSEAGHIYVEAPVTWAGATTLTLTAHGNIYVNAPITATNAAGQLTLEYGQGAVETGNTARYFVSAPINLQAGVNFRTKLGSDGATLAYTVITSLGAAGSTTGTDLQGMRGNLTGLYALGANIDASATAGWNGNAGFEPIGDRSSRFRGTLDGLGHTISGLTIDRPSTNDIGLIGSAGSGALVRNLGMKGGRIKGSIMVGPIVGWNYGVVRDCYATTDVEGAQFTGGLVGLNEWRVERSYATGSIKGSSSYTGGLVGENSGYISQSYATGAVEGRNYVGGLAGVNLTSIDQCFSTGRVTTTSFTNVIITGLTYTATQGGTVTNSYWATDTSGRTTGQGTGVTLAQLQSALPSGFDPNVWANAGNRSTPYLQTAPLGHAYIATDPGATRLYRVIQNVNQLQGVQNDLSERYALGNDIDASQTASWNAGAGFNPLGTLNVTRFTGTFDGLGNVIRNLSIDRSTQDGVGLFGEVENATIRNVGLEGGSVRGRDDTGGLVGCVGGGTIISNSHTSLSVTGDTSVGGLVGINRGTIRLSYATGNVSGSNRVGGFAGLMGAAGALIEQSYATGNVTASGSGIGGFVGFNTAGAIRQSYATGSVSGNTVVGGFAGAVNGGSMNQCFSTGVVANVFGSGGLVGTGTTGVTNSYWATDSSGRSSSPSGTGLTLAQLEAAMPTGFDTAVWGNADNRSTPYIKGISLSHAYIDSDPGAANLYRIVQNVAELQAIQGTLAGRFALGNDINAAATSSWNSGAGFSPIGFTPTTTAPFTGTFDGLGHAIDRLTINRPTMDYQALFAQASGASIRDLDLTNVTVNGRGLTGALVGSAVSGSAFRDVSVTGNVSGTDGYVGGLFGLTMGGSVTRASSNVNVSVSATATASGNLSGNIGGLVGSNLGATIDNASSAGTVTVNLVNSGFAVNSNSIGGLAGNSTGAITNSTSSAAVTINLTGSSGSLDARNIGGLIGRTSAAVTSSNATGNVLITSSDPAFAYSSSIGGLVGNLNATISDSYATGDVTGAKSDAGGLVGLSTGSTITRSYATGDVTGLGTLGGLVGEANSTTVSFSHAEGTVSGTTEIGGLVGSNPSGSSITSSYATGNVVATSFGSGGLVGRSYGDVSKSYATGNVDGFTAAGGLVGAGASTTSIADSYATGNVTGSQNVAGLLGFTLGGTVDRSYATGSATASLRIAGGLVGSMSNASISNSYATGNATAPSSIGSLIGQIDSGTVTNSYAIGAISGGSSFRGGLVGYNGGTVVSSFWNTSAAGAVGIGGGNLSGATGLTTAQFQSTTGFMAQAAGWDFTGVWAPSSAGYYPELYTLSRVVRVDTADASQVYGDPTPTFGQSTMYGGPGSYVFGPVGDTLAVPTVGGSFSVTTPAGVHTIAGPGSLTSGLGESYRAVYTGDLTVTQRGLTVTTDSQTKVYGELDPTLTYTTSGMVNGDSLFGALERSGGDDVGMYAINRGTLDNSNYAITYIGNNLQITTRGITITVDSQSKIYGNSDPTLSYVIGGMGLVPGDILSGGLSRAAGENVGGYSIGQGTLSADPNYSVTYIGNTLDITARLLTITAGDKSKTYGDDDPELTYRIGGMGLVNGDTLTGELSRESGWNVGSYDILRGDLSAGRNYAITFDGGALRIDPAALVIRVNDASRKEGAPNPRFSVTGKGFRYDDQLGDLSGDLAFSGPGANAGLDSAPGTYLVSAGGLASQNYAITWRAGELTVSPVQPPADAPFISMKLGIDANEAAQPSAEAAFVSSPEGGEVQELSNLELYRMFNR